MSACIYHDAESVTICPSCDFAVCQECLDGGADGMCANCTEDRARQQSQVAAEEVERCKYCRIAADEETTLDHDGYCTTCSALPRCATHDDLIAFDHCKSCRQQFCRKCLGFNNVCEACTIKQKAAPPRPPKPAAAAGGTGPVKRPDGAKKGTGPVRKGEGPPRPKRPRPPGAAPAKGASAGARRKKGEPELDEKGRPKKRPPSRGTQAMEAKLQKNMNGNARKQLIATAVVVGACVLVLCGSFVMRASSAESKTKVIQEQMLAVHQAAVAFHNANHRWPSSAGELQGELARAGVKGAAKIKISDAPAPSVVVYQLSGEDGFMVTGADPNGEIIKTANGTPIALDQYFSP